MEKKIFVYMVLLIAGLILASGCVNEGKIKEKSVITSDLKQVKFYVTSANTTDSIRSIVLKLRSPSDSEIKTIKLPDGNLVKGSELLQEKTLLAGSASVYLKKEADVATIGILWKNGAIKGDSIPVEIVIGGTEDLPEIVSAIGRNETRKEVKLNVKKV